VADHPGDLGGGRADLPGRGDLLRLHPATPAWTNAGGQLAGFLAYDLVLIVPFLVRLPTIPPEWFVSLVVYTAVVTYSGLLAAWYLFVSPTTRIGRPRAVADWAPEHPRNA